MSEIWNKIASKINLLVEKWKSWRFGKSTFLDLFDVFDGSDRASGQIRLIFATFFFSKGTDIEFYWVIGSCEKKNWWLVVFSQLHLGHQITTFPHILNTFNTLNMSKRIKKQAKLIVPSTLLVHISRIKALLDNKRKKTSCLLPLTLNNWVQKVSLSTPTYITKLRKSLWHKETHYSMG